LFGYCIYVFQFSFCSEFINKFKLIAKKYTNIGFRIEDNILVTENAYENLSVKAPKK